MFDEAKITEIQNLEGSSTISFITDPEEVRKIRARFEHRLLVPSRFILTKKQQELGQSWRAGGSFLAIVSRTPRNLSDMLQRLPHQLCTSPSNSWRACATSWSIWMCRQPLASRTPTSETRDLCSLPRHQKETTSSEFRRQSRSAYLLEVL